MDSDRPIPFVSKPEVSV